MQASQQPQQDHLQEEQEDQQTQAQYQPQPDDDVDNLDTTSLDQTNVFVKYLPSEVTDSGLHAMFSSYGEIVSCKVMVDTITGNSLGYGFVRFSTPDEALSAINAMSGTKYSNKTLLCKLSNSASINNSQPSDNLYIKPLLLNTTEDELREIFARFGTVKECKVMVNKQTGVSRQIGFVRMSSIEEASVAKHQMNGYKFSEAAAPLVVKFAESTPQKAARRAKLVANQAAAYARNSTQYYSHHPHQHQQYGHMYPGPSNQSTSPPTLISSSPLLSTSPLLLSSPPPISILGGVPYVIDVYGNYAYPAPGPAPSVGVGVGGGVVDGGIPIPAVDPYAPGTEYHQGNSPGLPYGVPSSTYPPPPTIKYSNDAQESSGGSITVSNGNGKGNGSHPPPTSTAVHIHAHNPYASSPSSSPHDYSYVVGYSSSPSSTHFIPHHYPATVVYTTHHPHHHHPSTSPLHGDSSPLLSSPVIAASPLMSIPTMTSVPISSEYSVPFVFESEDYYAGGYNDNTYGTHSDEYTNEYDDDFDEHDDDPEKEEQPQEEGDQDGIEKNKDGEEKTQDGNGEKRDKITTSGKKKQKQQEGQKQPQAWQQLQAPSRSQPVNIMVNPRSPHQKYPHKQRSPNGSTTASTGTSRSKSSSRKDGQHEGKKEKREGKKEKGSVPKGLSESADSAGGISTSPPSTSPSFSTSPPSSPSSSLFIFHLPSSVDNTALHNLFAPFGNLRSVKVMTDTVSGLSKGYGFVEYTNPQEAANAVTQMNGYSIENKHLKVTFKHPKTNQPQPLSASPTVNLQSPPQQQQQQQQQQLQPQTTKGQSSPSSS